jgi:excisionase family DNA binding protein
MFIFENLPENVNVTVTKSDLIDLINICLTKNQNSKAKEFPPHLSIKQLSEYINYSEPAVYRMVSQAAIPCYKIAGKILFKKSEIDNWLIDFKQRTVSEKLEELREQKK